VVDPECYVDCDCDRYAAEDVELFRQCEIPTSPPSYKCLCWTDRDPGVAGNADCHDDEADVYPLQGNFFSTGYGTSGDQFDYNCDESEEKRWGLYTSPTWDEGQGVCLGSGFVTSIPACGDTGYFRPAVKSDSSCTTGCACRWQDSYYRDQECQ
jgi:hypothetical protein